MNMIRLHWAKVLQRLATVSIWSGLVVLGACTPLLNEPPAAVATVTATSPSREFPTSPSTRQSVTAAPTATPSSTPVPTMTAVAQPIENKLGIHLLLDDGRNQWPQALWPLHLRFARQAVGEGGYVTELVRMDDLEISRWQRFMDLCAEEALTPVLRLATVYDEAAGWWEAPPVDPDGTYQTIAARYASFVADLNWLTTAHFIIVGNEPNHGNEWSGHPEPAAYARFLIDVATALHTADPAAQVLNAGLDPYTPHTNGQPFMDGMSYMDEETFLDEMVAAYPHVFMVIDVWSSHSYPLGPLTEPPWLQTYAVDMLNNALNPRHVVPPAGIYNRGVNGYEWELFKLATYGIDSLPVMITETGWRHAETSDPTTTDNGRLLPDALTVARYFDLAFYGNNGRYPDWPETGWTPWVADSRVMAVTPFALNGFPSEWGHTNWLALDAQGRILHTYAPFDLLTTEGIQPSGQ